MSTLATGAPLTQETFDDFKQRLHYHCNGAGVEDHCTSCAWFLVEQKEYICGVSTDYTDNLGVYWGETSFYSMQEFWDSLEQEDKDFLDAKAMEDYDGTFLDADYLDWQEDIIKAWSDDAHVFGWTERWTYLNAHFTKEAAEAFIKRKKHDYPDGLRVYVDSQYWSWEFNTIKEAILNGTLVYKEKE